MLTVCCSTKLLKELRVEDAPESRTAEPRMGEWYATVLQMRPQPLLLVVNEPTRLSVVLPVRDFDVLGQKIADGIVRVLKDLRADPGVIEYERRAMADVEFTKTANRSVRATMDEFTVQLELLRNASPHMAEPALAAKLGQVLVMIPRYGYQRAADVAKEFLADADSESGPGASRSRR